MKQSSAYSPNIHHRRSIRLKGYDYANVGLYFVTSCVQNGECLFGKIVNGEMIWNDAGKMVETEWVGLQTRFPNIVLHEFVVMPNHFHGILEIVWATLVVAPFPTTVTPSSDATAPSSDRIAQNNDPDCNDNAQPQGIGQPQGVAPTTEIQNDNGKSSKNKTVGDMMDAFKSITTVEYIRGVKNLNWRRFNSKLWQRNYYEHIIRNEESYHRISNYILNNPANWKEDKFHRTGST